jgi:hypothetical protein
MTRKEINSQGEGLRLLFPPVQLKPSEKASLESALTVSHVFRLLDVTVEIQADDGEALNLFRGMYRRFSSEGKPDLSFRIAARNSPLGVPLFLEGNRVFQVPRPEYLPSYTFWRISQSVFRNISSFFLFHAGAVCRGGRCLLIAGPPSCGKTTLVLRLVERGFRFLSDEMAPVHRDSHSVEPFPRGIGLREEARRSTGHHGILAGDTRVGAKWIVDIENMFPGTLGTASQPTHLVILEDRSARERDRKDGYQIDLGLLYGDPVFVKELERVSGAASVKRVKGSEFPLYRISFKGKGGGTPELMELTEKFEDAILYMERTKGPLPHFDEPPSLEPMPPAEAAMTLFRDLRNGDPRGALAREYQGRLSLLFFDVARVVGSMRCYRMWVGRLDEMVEAIEEML